jgi:hypothetical protein
MSINLITASPLANASIQYTYPEMDIRGIQTFNTSAKKFFFRNGLSSSSFSFTDSGNSIYKSGIASEGIISTGKHNNNSHELTIKNITTAGDLFYVVFPISTGGTSSFIDEIKNGSGDINVINMNVENKSLNTMITASKVYKYTNNNEKLVFVFEKSIKTNSLSAIKDSHSEWSGVSKSDSTINMIDPGSSEKVTEEIVCDSTGDTEQTINNEPLNRGAAKIGWTTLIFLLLAGWIGYFYSIPFINTNISAPTELNKFGWSIIALAVVFIPTIIMFILFISKIKWGRLSTYQNPYTIVFFLLLLWPIDFIFRTFAYFILSLLNTVINFDNDLSTIEWLDFVKGYLNSTNIIDHRVANSNISAKYALYVLFAVWLVAIFAIVSK